MSDANKALIRRYYESLWNEWNDAAIDELIAEHVVFRGSLGITVRNRAEFRDYVRLVRVAFPDFHNTIEELIAEEDRVAVRLTYTGTHRGPLLDIPPTGRSIRYDGLALLTICNNLILRGFVLGDTHALRRQLQSP
ncbi:MAG: ester cyclase [Phycisphaerae bacterium]|nr:ester cyclase [Phycisphaerae bacterium]